MCDIATSEIRGFNYSGSWGTSGLDLWQHHDHGTMATEIARGKKYFPGWNTARWWLSHDAFTRNPQRFLANLDAGLTLFARHHITVIPVLFNRWRCPTLDWGGINFDHIFGAFGPPDLTTNTGMKQPGEPTDPTNWAIQPWTNYVEQVIGTFAHDTRIYAWDMCNEPFSGWQVSSDTIYRRAELSWLTWIHNLCTANGATQPLTIGSLPDPDSLTILEPLVDIIAFQGYYIPNYPTPTALPVTTKTGFETFLDQTLTLAHTKNKNLLIIETGWGAIDDLERADILRYTLNQLTQRNIGFTAHALHHSLIADLHAPQYGPVTFPGRLEFINADGTLRPGHEVFNDFAPATLSVCQCAEIR